MIQGYSRQGYGTSSSKLAHLQDQYTYLVHFSKKQQLEYQEAISALKDDLASRREDLEKSMKSQREQIELLQFTKKLTEQVEQYQQQMRQLLQDLEDTQKELDESKRLLAQAERSSAGEEVSGKRKSHDLKHQSCD